MVYLLMYLFMPGPRAIGGGGKLMWGAKFCFQCCCFLDRCYFFFVFIYNNTNESRGVARLTSKHGLAEDAIEGNAAADVAFKLLPITIVRLAIQVSVGNAFIKRSMYSRRLIGLKEKLGCCVIRLTRVKTQHFLPFFFKAQLFEQTYRYVQKTDGYTDLLVTIHI